MNDILEISIPDQSQWGAETVVPPGQWELTLVDVHEDVTIGEIVEAGVTIRNPAHIAWQTAYNACRVTFSHDVCINGATLPFVGQVGGLGNPPPATITVPLGQNGLELDASVDLEAGFFGNFGLREGTFSVDYSAAVTLTSEQASYVPGQVATITFMETAPEAITMTTNGAQVEFNVGAFADLAIDASMEIWAAGLGGPLDLVDLDTGRIDFDLFNAFIGDSGIHMNVLGFEHTFDLSDGIGVKTFTYPPSPFPVTAGIPLGEVRVFVPGLDTPPSSTWDPVHGVLVNTQLPIDRSSTDPDEPVVIGGGDGIDRTDIARVELDVDGWISSAMVPPIPLGLVAGIPVVARVEGNLLDLDVGAYLSIGQTFTLYPELVATLDFGQTVTVLRPDGGTLETNIYTMLPGENVSFLYPEGDLAITPSYEFGYRMQNVTSLYVSPVVSLSVLELQISGVEANWLDAAFNGGVIRHTFPLGDPIPVLTWTTDDLHEDGFWALGYHPEGIDFGSSLQVAGNGSLFLAARDPDAPGGETGAVPEPATWSLMALGFAALAGRTHRRRRRL
ncbi:MAG TPA: PEP-CTERM sorting domain-containing protein [Vicinamibacterales bacterium]|nr:PEP-CTERM sorting domain-containing protein [Vicinamibacterales bacterium]